MNMSFSTPFSSRNSREYDGDVKDTVQNICALYICDLPDSLMDSKILRRHFSKYAPIDRMYLSNKRKSCTVHFNSHEEADYARKHGTNLDGIELNIFWSHSKSSETKSKTSPSEVEAAKRIFKRTRLKSGDKVEYEDSRVRNIQDHKSPLKSQATHFGSVFCTPASSSMFGNSGVGSSVSSSNSQLVDDIGTSSHSSRDSVEKQKKYTFKLAQKMVKNCVRKEMSFYKSRRSVSHSDDNRDTSPAVRVRDPHSKKDRTRTSPSDSDTPAKTKIAKMDLPDDVLDELQVMGGLDKMRVIERPKAVMQLPWKLRSMDTPSDSSSQECLVLRRSKLPPSAQTTQQPADSEADICPLTLMELESILRQPANTVEMKYKVLDARDKLMHMRNVQSNSTAKRNWGTCPDMCPEKERYQRIMRHQLEYFETRFDEDLTRDCYHQFAVKQYARSSADQQMPLAHDLRPVSVLRMTMNHLVKQFMDLVDNPKESLGDWYHFLWDRTRSIRKDITQQEICDKDSVIIVEQCARFHIFCSERMREEDISVYDEKINTENLTKCLQTLKYMYSDLTFKGEICPNEAEFQAYKVLLNLNNGSCMIEIQSLKDGVQQSEPIKFAIQVYLALANNNYVKFFKLVKSCSYLNACILHRYFHQVRAQAIRIMVTAYCSGRRETAFPLADLQNLLLFDSVEEVAEFCRYFHITVRGEDAILQHVKKLHVPSVPLVMKRAHVAVESKRTISVSEIIAGGFFSDDEFPLHLPHNSFTPSGFLKPEAWNAEDQAVDEVFTLPTPPVLNTEEMVSLHDETEEEDMQVEFEELLEEPLDEPLEEPLDEPQYIETDTVNDNNVIVEMVTEPREEISLRTHEESVDVLDIPVQEIEPEFITDEEESIAEPAIQVEEQVEMIAEKEEDVAVQDENRSSQSSEAWIVDEMALSKSPPPSPQVEEMEVTDEVSQEGAHSPVIMSDGVGSDLHSTSDEEVAPLLLEDHEAAKEDTRLETSSEEETVQIRSPVIYVADPNFPAWFSPLTREQQVAHLDIPGGASDFSFRERRLSEPFSYYCEKSLWPVTGKIYMEHIIMDELRTRRCERETYWKLLLSLPDEVEAPRYSRALLRWADQTFQQEEDDDDDDDTPIERVRILRLARERTHYGYINSSVQRTIGCPDKAETFLGVSGLLLFVTSDCDDVGQGQKRLVSILQSRQPQPLLPVAIITDSSELSQDDGWLRQLVNEKRISQFKIFRRTSCSVENTAYMVESAVKWLACNAPHSPDYEMMPLQYLWDRYVVDDLWSRIYRSVADEEDEDIADLIDIHNLALETISKLCLRDELFNYSTNAPEFELFMNLCDYPVKTFINKIAPADWGTSKYKEKIQKVCSEAQLLIKLHPSRGSEVSVSTFFDACIDKYPELATEFNHAIWLLCQGDEFTDKIRWTYIIQVLSALRMAMVLSREDNRNLLVAIRRDDLLKFRTQFCSKFNVPSTDVCMREESRLHVDYFPAINPLNLEDIIAPKCKINLEKKLKLVTDDYEHKDSKRRFLEIEEKLKENEEALKHDLAKVNSFSYRIGNISSAKELSESWNSRAEQILHNIKGKCQAKVIKR